METNATIQYDDAATGARFVLESDRVLRVMQPLGMRRVEVYPFADIADVECVGTRIAVNYVVPLIIGAAFVLGAIKSAENDFAVVVTLLLASMGIMSVFHVVRGMKPVETYRFRNKRGEVIFAISRPTVTDQKRRPIYERFSTAYRPHSSDSSEAYVRFIVEIRSRLDAAFHNRDHP